MTLRDANAVRTFDAWQLHNIAVGDGMSPLSVEEGHERAVHPGGRPLLTRGFIVAHQAICIEDFILSHFCVIAFFIHKMSAATVLFVAE